MNKGRRGDKRKLKDKSKGGSKLRNAGKNYRSKDSNLSIEILITKKLIFAKL